MAKRYKPQAPTPLPFEGTNQLPTELPIAVYYRQSTDAQVGNISTTLQTVDMVEYLKRRGWAADKIIMIDMDAGISGTTKIDERPGMSALFQLISKGAIGAVACQDEDRLFRDVTQIQVNIFIEACRTAQVLVITPSMVYDFANDLTGSFHARQFRFKSEMAAEYISAFIRGKLHRAKRHLLLEGRWAGSGMPPGFMVDMRKTLPDGQPNPAWRRYVPFEPYAAVINEYFRLFLAHAGQVRATLREIQEHGPYYPDPETTRPPEGFRVSYRLQHYGKGYSPGRTGLVSILTNAAYIGHWAVNDQIIRWNNHPALVPFEVFTQAYNYLSKVTLEGKPNLHFTGMPDQDRPSRSEQRAVERPLLSGILVHQDQGEWHNVGTFWISKLHHYTYVAWGAYPYDKYLWGKRAYEVDEWITRLLLEKLRLTFDQDTWEETLAAFQRDYHQGADVKTAQLQQLTRVMDNLIASLDTLTHKDMIIAAQKRYEEAQAEHHRLTTELEHIKGEASVLTALQSLRTSYAPAVENWPNMTRDEKRVVIRAFVRTIEATATKNHGLELTIRWRDGSFDRLTLPRVATGGDAWLPPEVERLLYLIDQKVSQVEIAREFPDRPWKNIRNKAWSLLGKGTLTFTPKPIKDPETYWDFLKRSSGKKNTLVDISFDACSEKVPPCAREISRRGAGYYRRRPAQRTRWCGAARETAGCGSVGSRWEAGRRPSRCGLRPGLHRWSCAAG